VEEDFTIAMEQRRAEALAALAAERETTRRELQELRESAAAQAREVIARAEQQARESIEEAERRVAELVTARIRIAEQLGRTRTMLDDTLGSLALPPEQLLAPAHAAATAPPAAQPTARTAGGNGADQAGAFPAAHDRPDSDHRKNGSAPVAVPAADGPAADDARPGETDEAASLPGPDVNGSEDGTATAAAGASTGENEDNRPHRRQRRRARAGSSRR
jgi:hypothetical protein